jgi:hypothetical protein
MLGVSSHRDQVSDVGLPIVKVPGGQKILSILIDGTVWLGRGTVHHKLSRWVVDRSKSLLTTRE